MTSAVSLTTVSTESVDEAGESALKLAWSSGTGLESNVKFGRLGDGPAIRSGNPFASTDVVGSAPDITGASGK